MISFCNPFVSLGKAAASAFLAPALRLGARPRVGPDTDAPPRARFEPLTSEREQMLRAKCFAFRQDCRTQSDRVTIASRERTVRRAQARRRRRTTTVGRRPRAR